MDAGRFDALSKSLAVRRSRRSLGAGGLAAGLLAALGVEHAVAATKSCSLTILATTATGAHKDKKYSGTLKLQIGDQGAIDAGSFDLADGTSLALVGQATGRALHLRITLADKTVLALEGTAAADLVLCRGSASGTFGGPSDTDLGTWRTVERAGTGTGTSATPTSAATGSSAANAAGSGSSAGDASGNDSGSGNAGGSATAAGMGAAMAAAGRPVRAGWSAPASAARRLLA